MIASKRAVRDAFAHDDAIANLVPPAQIFSVERSTVPTLPAVEVIAISSERIGDGPMVRHSMSIEITASDPTEDGADETLDSIVAAVRARLSDAADSTRPDGTGERWKRPGRTESDTVVYLRKRPSVRDTRRKRERHCRGRRVLSTAIWVPRDRRDTVGPWVELRLWGNVTLFFSFH